MTVFRSIGFWVVRLRFLVLAMGVLGVFYEKYVLHPNDYLFFEYFARTVTSAHGYTGGWEKAGHIYSTLPVLQVGPPGLWAAVPFQLLTPAHSNLASSLAMMFALVPALFLIESIARHHYPAGPHLGPYTLMAGLVLIAPWENLAVRYMHLDDVLVYLCALGSIRFIQSGRAAPAALLMGTATATKPWAIALVPVLMALPRGRRPTAGLVWIVTFLFWWLPFLLIEPNTFNELSQRPMPIVPGSSWYSFGVHGDTSQQLCRASSCYYAAYSWMRSLMFLVSAGLAAAAVLRGRWLAAPLIGLAARCALDTQAWNYYAVGPVLFALLWDMTQGHRFPRWTVAALVLEYAGVTLGNGFVSGMCRTFFFVLVTVVLVIRRRQDHQPMTEVSQATRAGGLVSV